MAGGENNPPRPLIKVQQPDPFTWIAEEWPAWSMRFMRYRRLSKLDQEEPDVQLDVLLYLMGEKADIAMKTFKFTAPETATNVEHVIKKFDVHFGGKVNVIYERAKFNQRSQKAGEFASDFITDLYSMAEKCNYGNLKEELIRDRIIVGIANVQLSAAMQMDATIDLTKVRERVLQAEDVGKQLPVLRNGHGDAAQAQVNFVRKGGKKYFNKPKPQPRVSVSNQEKPSKPQNADKSKQRPCKKCGRTPSHPYSQCPAKDSICSKCNFKGHWAVSCRTGVGEATVENGPHAEEVTYYLECVSAEPRGNSLRVDITSNGTPVRWKIDSGADIPIIGNKTVDMLKPKDVLNPGVKVMLAGQVQANVIGKCQVRLEWKGKTYEVWAYVIPDQKEPLLSRHLALEMGLIKLAPEVLSVSQAPLPENQFPEIFDGLGCMKEEYLIKLAEGAQPYAVTQSRRVSVPLFQPTKKAIDELLQLDAIEPVTDPSPWCAPLVPVPKPDGSVRLTIDYTELNQYVLRECFEMPTVDECLATIGTDAKVFSKLEAKWGYWQVKLAEQCRSFTTFITPFGRYRWKRMPMGLKSSGEIYKSRKVKILEGLEGVINHVDDDLVWGKTVEEHDERLRKVLRRYKEAGITLNRAKCQFRVSECDFLGQKVSAATVKPGAKIQDLLDMPVPKDETALRSFLSSVRYYLKFVPNLSQILKPLNDMLSADSNQEWTSAQQESFDKTKKALASAPVLALFDTRLPTRVTADASKYGLGAVLEQQQKSGEWKPVHFASRVLSDPETRYAQIEKEALGSTWACEKLSWYLIGLDEFELRTDHKPLITILGSKPMNELSTRLQRFRMRLTPFRYKITFVPGKCMYVADTLSRLPSTNNQGHQDVILEVQIAEATIDVPMAPTLWETVKAAQQADTTCRLLSTTISEGWPRKPQETAGEIRKFFEHQGMLNTLGEVVMYGKRVYIPQAMRKDILGKLHQGHLGVTKCRGRALDTVWWPAISKEVGEFVERCEVCKRHRKNPLEPLMPTPTPSRPWETVGIDFAERGKRKYIVVVDYFSTYIEVLEVPSTSAAAVIPKLFEIFGRHGVPNTVRSDNGPPFNSLEFAKFASLCQFQHITSSPHAPWSNGKAEAAVKKAKQILAKEPLVHLGLLALRNAPLEEGPSPAQLLMGRRLRTPLPQLEEQLEPEWPDLEAFKERRREKQRKLEANFNERHRARNLEPLGQGDRVWVVDKQYYANVSGPAETPRSYNLITDLGSRIRRNRRDLITAPESAERTADPSMFQYLGILQNWCSAPPPPQTPPRVQRTPPRTQEPPPQGSSPPTPPQPQNRKKQQRTSLGGRGSRRSISPPKPGGAVTSGGTRSRPDIRPPARYRP